MWTMEKVSFLILRVALESYFFQFHLIGFSPRKCLRVYISVTKLFTRTKYLLILLRIVTGCISSQAESYSDLGQWVSENNTKVAVITQPLLLTLSRLGWTWRRQLDGLHRTPRHGLDTNFSMHFLQPNYLPFFGVQCKPEGKRRKEKKWIYPEWRMGTQKSWDGKLNVGWFLIPIRQTGVGWIVQFYKRAIVPT